MALKASSCPPAFLPQVHSYTLTENYLAVFRQAFVLEVVLRTSGQSDWYILANSLGRRQKGIGIEQFGQRKLIKGSFRSFANIQNPARCGVTVAGYIRVFSRILGVLNSYSTSQSVV